LKIIITDNGAGMGGANLRGRGLANMQARAESIGGRVDVQSSEEGVSVVLNLPQRSRRDD
jgi:signal transduction histidine kinase